MTYVEVNSQNQKDLLVMESIAIPLSFVVLVWVFGGLLAAAVPLAVGVFAILGSMAVLRAVTYVTDVSIFALNLTVALSLALAIDYTLLIVSRFRDELADGADRNEALIRTMATAGRTVLFSAMTVALSMVAMVLFPMYFLKSFAYAGVAVVAFAAVAAVVVTPAAIVLLGDRLDSWDVRRLAPPAAGRARARCDARSSRSSGTARRKFVMRHADCRSASRSSRCCLCSAPRSSVSDGVFPTTACCPAPRRRARWVTSCATILPIDSSTNVTVVIPDLAGVTPTELDRYAARAVAGSGRVVGVCAGRHVRWRLAGRAAVGGNGDQGRQRILDRRQHRAAVLAGFGDPAGPVARRRRSRRPTTYR